MTKPESPYSNLTEQYSSKGEGYYEAARSEMLEFIPLGASTFLDVGCSSGVFGAELKKSYPSATVWGIELDKQAATAARLKLDHVIEGSFEAGLPELEEKKFDCIIFNDVLEHLVNPGQILLECKNYLSDGGNVVASIPNILYWPAMYEIIRHQDWRYQDSGILDNTHLRFFTKKSAVRMFEDAGYEVSRCEGINPLVMKRYTIANFLLLDHLRDWKYLQFAIVANPKEIVNA
jgi:2-polyprenyl-3-methyl-5-hydroxy-6-metoxy-1,4-benzoquinol methylase